MRSISLLVFATPKYQLVAMQWKILHQLIQKCETICRTCKLAASQDNPVAGSSSQQPIRSLCLNKKAQLRFYTLSTAWTYLKMKHSHCSSLCGKHISVQLISTWSIVAIRQPLMLCSQDTEHLICISALFCPLPWECCAGCDSQEEFRVKSSSLNSKYSWI